MKFVCFFIYRFWNGKWRIIIFWKWFLELECWIDDINFLGDWFDWLRVFWGNFFKFLFRIIFFSRYR